MWKGKYQSKDNIKIGKERGNFLTKNKKLRDLYMTNTHKHMEP